jgi:hypothetical protein
MADEPTCGQGLAAHAVLPMKLGAMAAALAENLEVHLDTLDMQDENARQEHGVYLKLAKEHRTIAAHLQATAEEMAGYWDLPMGRHDEQVVSSPKVFDAFSRYVDAEQELLALLQESLEQDRRMLADMGAAGGNRA